MLSKFTTWTFRRLIKLFLRLGATGEEWWVGWPGEALSVELNESNREEELGRAHLQHIQDIFSDAAKFIEVI